MWRMIVIKRLHIPLLVAILVILMLLFHQHRVHLGEAVKKLCCGQWPLGRCKSWSQGLDRRRRSTVLESSELSMAVAPLRS
jgi:hypothetical protein